MFKRLFQRAAAKASLTNIKFDLDRLSAAFPEKPQAVSKAMFTLMENISFAFDNHASVEEVKAVISARSGAYPAALKDILENLVELAAVEGGDTAKISQYDSRLSELFREATGAPLDVTQLPWFTKLAMGKSGSSASAMFRANQAFDEKRFQEAAHLLEKTLQDDPSCTEAWTNLGNAYEKLNRLEDAERAHKKGLESRPNDELPWVNLGVVYGRMGRDSDEMACYTKSVQLKPDFWFGWMKLGLAHRKAHEHANAVMAFERAAELAPEKPQLWALLAQDYDQIGQTELSKQALARAKQLS